MRSRPPPKTPRPPAPAPAPTPSDPFTALALLRTLLSPAPRKPTPAEHALALRLLALLEHTLASPLLLRQPTEVLDMIAFRVDAKRDLQALALTCRRMRAVVCPRHVEYRVVRCRPSAERVWAHLARHPGLARGVRRLHVMDERAGEAEIVPSRAREEEEGEEGGGGVGMHARQQRLMVDALAKMTTLVAFAWSCNTSLISFDDVAPTLLMCASLRDVEITDNGVFSPIPADTPAPRKVPSLTSIAIRTAKNPHRQHKHPSLTRLQNLLIAHCPHLTTLRIGYDHARPFIPLADDFLARGRWPSLRALSLQNLWCSPHAGFGAAAAFLGAHPRVEVLHFEMGRVQLELEAGTLPRLRELVCGREEVAVAILGCAGGRPVEVLRGVKVGGGRDDGRLVEVLRGCGKTLRRVELGGWGEVEDVRRVAEAVPGVTWLDVGKKKTPSKAVPSVNEWALVMGALPELTALHGVAFFYECSEAGTHSDRSRMRKNDEVASVLAWKCPGLRRVDYWEGSGKVVVLGEGKWRVK